jgi:1-acyl-sn-glycerol-3-phosphate acyltransferase
MIILLPGILIPFVFGQRFGWISYKFLALWSWIFSILNFIHYKIIGKENIQKGESYIYVSNHTSFLDIPGITMAIPGGYRPLAKKELLKIPVFGWIAKSAAVIVDRSSGQSRKQSMDHLRDILDMGISILIFVEGTQNRTKEILQPFKDGAFRIAVDTQKSLLPMVVIGAGPLMKPGTIDMKPGTIKVVIGEAIPVKGLTPDDVIGLKEKTFNIMKEMIETNA